MTDPAPRPRLTPDAVAELTALDSTPVVLAHHELTFDVDGLPHPQERTTDAPALLVVAWAHLGVPTDDDDEQDPHSPPRRRHREHHMSTTTPTTDGPADAPDQQPPTPGSTRSMDTPTTAEGTDDTVGTTVGDETDDGTTGALAAARKKAAGPGSS
jgi:hypothetical protein